MNRFEKAAAFGRMMGNRASLLKRADRFYDGAPGKKYGDPSLKAPAELSANQVQANEQLQGNVPIPGVQEGPAGKNRDMARMQHYGRDQSNADVANLKPNTLAAERSAQQKDSDGKAISTVASMLPFSSVANGPLNRAFSPAAAKSPATPNFYPLKPIGSDNVSQFKNTFGNFANLRRGPKPPTPPIQLSAPNAPSRPLTGEIQGSRPPYPATDAMRQEGWKFSPTPPVGKPFSKLPNQ